MTPIICPLQVLVRIIAQTHVLCMHLFKSGRNYTSSETQSDGVCAFSCFCGTRHLKNCILDETLPTMDK